MPGVQGEAVTDPADPHYGLVAVSLTGKPDENGRYGYVTGGASGRFRRLTKYFVSYGVIRSAFSMQELQSNVGAVNKSTFLGYSPGTVVVDAIEVPKVYLLGDGDEVVPVVVTLLVAPEPFQTTTRFAQYAPGIVGEGVVFDYDSNGNPLHYFKSSMDPTDLVAANGDGSAPATAVFRAVSQPVLQGSGSTVVLTLSDTYFETLATLLAWTS
jgi:hypothetical protein